MSAIKNDWSAFNAKAAVEAEKTQPGYYKTLAWQERMIIANYLNSIKYDYPENDPPRMDKTYFKARSMAEINKETDGETEL
ncbi:hypothetical protein [Mucilaginibacter sp.]|uniref:hypothetical protein n=1 Tax=Mucilaginibacter sp. TaxID=1882438 RepID=UPI0026158ABC|nr:hypothetical protein [Mucilaginibacter sp.]MDB4923895.1 hypothetical protein [Mucilaginibacter sp.]